MILHLGQKELQIWQLVNFNISVCRSYKIQQSSTEHLQINFEMQYTLYTSENMCK